MKFYSSIHQVYDHIFPLKQPQVKFVTDEIPKSAKVLDIGCAVGSLSMKLADLGYNVSAFDLDEDMIDFANKKSMMDNLEFRVGNMLNMQNDYSEESFDGVLCFGNTMVHLPESKYVLDFFKGAYSIMKNGGKFLFQILNYDYVLQEKIEKLPLIDNEHVRFERFYKYDDNNKINFITKLKIKESDEVINNEIQLLPITGKTVLNYLNEVGFKNIEVFGSFAKEELMSNSLPFVVKAEK